MVALAGNDEGLRQWRQEDEMGGDLGKGISYEQEWGGTHLAWGGREGREKSVCC